MPTGCAPAARWVHHRLQPLPPKYDSLSSLRTSLRWLHERPDLRLVDVQVSIEALAAPTFENNLHQLLQQFPVNPGRVCLALTELDILEQHRDLMSVISAVTAIGFTVCVSRYVSGLIPTAALANNHFRHIVLSRRMTKRLMAAKCPPILEAIVAAVNRYSLCELVGVLDAVEPSMVDEMEAAGISHYIDLSQGAVIGCLSARRITALD